MTQSLLSLSLSALYTNRFVMQIICHLVKLCDFHLFSFQVLKSITSNTGRFFRHCSDYPQDIPADAGFLCNKASLIGDTSKKTLRF
jgi:hypothetical protein